MLTVLGIVTVLGMVTLGMVTILITFLTRLAIMETTLVVLTVCIGLSV